MNPGVRVGSAVVELLQSAGVEVSNGVARIPSPSFGNAWHRSAGFLSVQPQGEKAVHYGGDDVHFDPGSCCVQMLDPETMEARPSETSDLVRLVQVTEMLPQFAAQSPPSYVVIATCPARSAISIACSSCCNIRQAGGDGIVLRCGLQGMIDLLAADSGGLDKMREERAPSSMSALRLR